MDKRLIISFLNEFNINNDEIVLKFEKYINYLLLTNEKFNLVSFKDETEILEVHIRDSLEFLKTDCFNPNDKYQLIDIGSGAGFPGLPICIVMKSWQITLVESIRKKANFLNLVTKIINCKNITVKNERAENLIKNLEFREKFDFVTARWVSRGDNIVSLLSQFIKKDGKIILWKNPEELNNLDDYKRVKIHKYNIEEREKYILILSKK